MGADQRRQLRTEKLIDVYVKLEQSIDRAVTPNIICDLEDAFIFLQLFGTKAEIKNTATAALALSRVNDNDPVDIDNLIKLLRSSLRKELGLPSYDGPIYRIRLTYRGADARELVAGKSELPQTIIKSGL